MSDEISKSLRDAIAHHARSVLVFLTRRVGAQDAPDLAQETFLRVLRHAESETIAEPASLLHSTAANLARDHMRRRRTQTKYLVHGVGLDEFSGSTPSPSARLEAKDTTAQLLAALDALSPRCREVFILRRFEHLHQAEIASRLGISRNMVEKHLRTAFKELRKSLK